MYQTARLAGGRAALTFLAAGLACGAASAAPLTLPPLLSQPPTFAAAFSLSRVQATFSLSALSAVRPARTPEALQPSLPPMVLPGAIDFTTFALPTADDWRVARLSDPSLRLTDWRDVFDVARLGMFVVPLRSDPGERANIILSSQAVDNAVVEPGEIFSFNETVGERTPERGYQDGLMFSDGQIVRGTGGGICLVATGLYNAALQAGLGVIERHPHSGVVGYAPPGCDAGIAYGSEDMRFQNTTDAPIIVKTDIQQDQIIVGLFGQTPPPGRKVYVKTTHLTFLHASVIEQPDATLPIGAPPVVVQKPHLGYDVTVERFFKQGNQTVRREVITTEHREPRPKIVRVPAPPAVTPPGLPPVPGAATSPLTVAPGPQPKTPKQGTTSGTDL